MAIGMTGELVTTVINVLDDLLVGLGTSTGLDRLLFNITKDKIWELVFMPLQNDLLL